jgi:23S rRNA pseudouridine2605 synthase
MSKKDNPKSYFEKTFGKTAAPKSQFNDGERDDKKPFGDKKKPFSKDKKSEFSDKRKSGAEGRFEQRGRSEAPRKPFDRKDNSDVPRRRFDDKEWKSFDKRNSDDDRRKPFERKESDVPRKRFDNKSEKPFDRDKKPFGKNDRADFKKNVPNRRPSFDPNKLDEERKPLRDTDNQTRITRDNQVHNVKIGAHLKPNKKNFEEEEDFDDEDITVIEKAPEKMPLNKYIAHCGICSRRDAVEFIKQGKVKVNGVLAEEPGMKISDGDAVSVAGRKIAPTKNLAYLLLNKPKGFITTTEDEKGRRTIMDLVASSEAERLYPIGRLDRNTTGLIILTNDGELAQKLSHPKYNVKKIYQVTLDKPITKADFEKVLAGVTLEDGIAPVDSLAMLEEKNELGIEIHSGKNRIVRRIFEHLGYQVEKLDRVMYAGLTKKNLPRGKWRLLTDREVILLKHFKS